MKNWIIGYIAKRHQRMRSAIILRLSSNKNVVGRPKTLIPVQYEGLGTIEFGENVQLGCKPSPYFYDGITYLEARHPGSQLLIHSDCMINNGFVAIADKSSITIESGALIGTNVEIIDSDFHEMNPESRNGGNHKIAPVHIERNVFIGSNVKICKGVRIGENSVIGNGAIVLKDIPANSIAFGNPANVIKKIDEQ